MGDSKIYLRPNPVAMLTKICELQHKIRYKLTQLA